MQLDKYLFKSSFSSIVKPLVPEEKDKFLALASLVEVAKYIPQINSSQNVDLLGVAFDAFVANRFNSNDDGANSADAVAIAKLYVNKPINAEHARDKVVGFIINYSFSEFGTNNPMTEEEALASTKPFNVILGGVIWRIVCPKFAKLIEDCSDPSSPNYQSISASWEIGFMEYDIAMIDSDSRNLSDARIISDTAQIKQLDEYLKASGGKGQIKETKLFRLIKGSILPLGIGFTENPAADVKGIATVKTIETPKDLDKTEISANNISQTKENNVIQERQNIMAIQIKKMEDINDENLKQAKASEITTWIKEQMDQASQTFQEEKTKLETEVKASKDAYSKLETETTQLKQTLATLQASVDSLNKEKETRANQDLFNSRMSALDSTYELNDAERQVITSDIAKMDETAYAAYQTKLSVLLAAKKKVAQPVGKVAPKKDENQDAKMESDEKKAKECKASTAAKTEVVEAALDNAKPDKTTLPATTSVGEEGVLEQFRSAFAVSEWVSDVDLKENE